MDFLWIFCVKSTCYGSNIKDMHIFFFYFNCLLNLDFRLGHAFVLILYFIKFLSKNYSIYSFLTYIPRCIYNIDSYICLDVCITRDVSRCA